MTDTVREQLSALIDGELADSETELLLKRLDRDAELRLTLSRYSLIGAALRTDGQISAARGVAARVSAAVALEPAVPVAASTGLPRWARLAAGMSVAASVAALAVVFGTAPALRAVAPAAQPTVAAIGIGQPVVLTPATATPVALNEPLPSYTTPPAGGSGMGTPDPQLARYFIAHADYAAPLVRRGLVSSLVSAEVAPEPPTGRVAE